MTTDWNAATYDRIADPQARWGAAVLDRLPLAGDERVIDAGCGTGRVTAALAERLPHGSIIAVDASPAMIAEAERRLAAFGDRVEYVVADLARPLPIEGTVDAVLSTATFHWVLDHDALFANLAAVMRSDGRLVAQCGGAGNIATLASVLRDLGQDVDAVYFATPAETKRRLEANGFVDVEAWLNDEPTTFEPGEPFESFLETVCLRPNLDRLPPSERKPFVREVARRMPSAALDYVRLNIVARRG
ncbi:MAG TPA: methyltransferase domain-containing protein [Candidatus Limnocylindrales bacterium]|nr:methyltransferase domain-containing protein [Candidatus Limnocylindrales bacterium]